jgi:hypothetical protein
MITTTCDLDYIDSIDKNISVNDILLENMGNPINEDEFKNISKYFDNLKQVGLIDLIEVSHFYDKSGFDFYFIIGDASRNWYKKLILKSTIIDLVLKHRIINYIVQKYYGCN